MGSHGGATAEGQRAIIESYGVTEEFCGAPIRSCMQTKYIGKTEDGRDVYIDRNAAEAEGIVVVGRVKPHTDFRGPYESGMMKMMVIGLVTYAAVAALEYRKIRKVPLDEALKNAE